MTLEEKVLKAKELDDSIDQLNAEIKALQEKLASTTEERVNVYADLLADAKAADIKDQKVNDLFITYFSKEDITWLDDAGLLAKLQENGANQFIKVVTKTTTSIDKNALKKAFKVSEELRETYKNFYGNKLTEYVTVTTEENHQKMLEHISENKK